MYGGNFDTIVADVKKITNKDYNGDLIGTEPLINPYL